MNRLTKFLIVIIIILIIISLYAHFRIEEKILKHFYPTKYSEYVYDYANSNEIDPLLIFAVIKTESNFKEKTVSRSGAIGLMQLMENTAEEQAKKSNLLYSKEKLYEPEYNIRLGTEYFASLLKMYDNNYILAFAAYNAGIGNVNNWIDTGRIKEDGSDFENIPFKETNMYVRKIIRNYKIYKRIFKVNTN